MRLKIPKKIRWLKKRQNKIIVAKQETLKQGNRLMRLGEVPTLYEQEAVTKTEHCILRYLQNQGYFDAVVNSRVTYRNHKAYVTYQVQENHPYTIGTMQLDIPDVKMLQLYKAHQNESCIKQGNRYTKETFLNEKERIYNLLGTHGYFNFDEQFITFIGNINGSGRFVQ